MSLSVTAHVRYVGLLLQKELVLMYRCRNTRLLAFMVDYIDDYLSTMYKCAIRLTT